MSEETEEKVVQPDEATAIKSRLDTMGIKYHHRAGIEKLRTTLKEALEPPKEKKDIPQVQAKLTKASVAPNVLEFAKGSTGSIMSEEEYSKIELSQLKRVQVSCKNPNKREWPGEFIDAGNKIVVQRKYVKFDTPYHIPLLVYNYLKEKQFQMFKVRLDAKGNEIKEGYLVNEYSVVDLPALTNAERKKIGMTQIMRNGQEVA